MTSVDEEAEMNRTSNSDSEFSHARVYRSKSNKTVSKRVY